MCLRLGKTRAQLRGLDEPMTNREFIQWAAYHSISPIDDERCHDLGPALVRATIAAANGAKDINPIDLLPFRKRISDAFDGFERGLARWAEKNGSVR